MGFLSWTVLDSNSACFSAHAMLYLETLESPQTRKDTTNTHGEFETFLT